MREEPLQRLVDFTIRLTAPTSQYESTQGPEASQGPIAATARGWEDRAQVMTAFGRVVRHLPHATFLLLLALAPMGACSCEEDTIREITPGTCEADFDCPQGLTYRLGACQVARCQDTGDCCPGQRCSVSVGLCVDQWRACTDDTECVQVPGQRCIDFRGGRFCGYPNRTGDLSAAGTQACGTDDDCPRSASCVGKRCLVVAPCEGGCPSAQVCDVDSNTCFTLPECSLSCTDGEVLVVEDPDTMSGDACCLPECRCATLPAVRVGQFGWHASLALQSSDVFISAYDAEYGDLVVARFNGDGQFQDVEYVDGFPTDGPIVADPTKRRGGRSQPGPDVGEYGSLALDNAGQPHVAYYDRSSGHLRYAVRTPTGWSSHVVDSQGDVGRFTSIALSPDGRPQISYMAAEALSPRGELYSALRFAEASVALPTGSNEWQVTEVERRPKAPLVCGGGCERNTTCVDLGLGPTCRPDADGCSACGTGQVCVNAANADVCADEVPVPNTLDDLPEGIGLFSSLAVTSTGAIYIAYYDRTSRSLRLARRESGGFITRRVDGGTNNDAGAHVSAAIGPGGVVGLAYMDFSNDDLIFAEPTRGVREIVDDGISPPDLRMVGADASLVYDRQGQPTIAYQDGTQLDLLFARRSGSPAMWSTERVRGRDGAAGFYATQAHRDGRAYVGSVAVGFDSASELELELSVDVLSVP